jgi:hypothetical protein
MICIFMSIDPALHGFLGQGKPALFEVAEQDTVAIERIWAEMLAAGHHGIDSSLT